MIWHVNPKIGDNVVVGVVGVTISNSAANSFRLSYVSTFVLV